MELPDDVLSIITEYSQPLKRRIVSDFWYRKGVLSNDEMMTIIQTEMKKQDIEGTLSLYHFWIWDGDNFDDLLDNDFGLFPDGKRYIQYINDNGVVIHTSNAYTVYDVYVDDSDDSDDE
jgi:hypothetical protein